MRIALSIGTGLALMLLGTAALAQGEPTTSTTTTTTPAASGSADASASVTAPRATAAATVVTTPAKKEDDGITDHEKVVGKFGVGYLGMTQLPLGSGAIPGCAGNTCPALPITRATVDAPVIGVRYWIRERFGIDAGIGFSMFSQSISAESNNTEVKTDGPSVLAVALHGGLPFAFAYGKHYKFLAIPEINVGFTRRAEEQTAPAGGAASPDVVRSGFRLDVGGRVGSEIQFGFIGVPELSLQATVGLNLRHVVWSTSQDAGTNVPTPRESSDSETGFGTTVQSDPWALFVNNVSAIYYFP